MQENAEVDSKLLRAKRVREIRLSARLNRPDLARKYKIPVGTLQEWEEPRIGGLTKKGAQRLVDAFANEGIVVTVDWLLEGTPPAPIKTSRPLLQEICHETASSEAKKSILLNFYQHNLQAIDYVIKDNLLSPAFVKGDIVAGQRYFGENIPKGVGHFCIVQIDFDQIIPGRLHELSPKRFVLETELDRQSNNLTIDSPLSVAPISLIIRNIAKES